MIDDDFDQFENDESAPTTPRAKSPAKKATKRAAKKAPTPPRRRKPEPPPEPEPEPEIQEGLPETAARQREAQDLEFVTVVQNGVTIEVPADQGQWPLAAMEFLMTGRTVAGVRMLVGDEQWNELIASGAKVCDASEIFDKVAVELGLGSAGKMMGLIALLEQRGGEIESDLQDKGIDLVDLYRGRLTLRKVAVLIKYLPPTSALALATNGGQAPWSLTEYLLSDIWALQARQLAGRRAPDSHPWRKAMLSRANATKSTSRRAALLRAQARHQTRNRPKVAGRGDGRPAQ
ncbi:tail assembly chaperone [Gordonia phage Kiko]|nr:tail assembly chaperone [Gordonia phage Kiko]